jgi:hypothetical protein
MKKPRAAKPEESVMGIDICGGMACGFWMRLSASGMVVLRGTNDAQMSVEQISVTPTQFAAMSRNDMWMAGPQWREVPTQFSGDATDYWRSVMLDWGMDPAKAYEVFDGMLPAATAKRMGLIKSTKANVR